MPTYPSTPQITADALLKQPAILSRDLSSLSYQRFIADRILAKGTSAMVQGGVVRYQRSESIFPDRSAEEMAPRSEFPRASWSEALLTEAVHQYGLEIPISQLTIRRHQIDQVTRAEIKLANQIVKFVDGKAMTLLTTDANVQTFAASGDWTTAATDIVLDLAEALRLIDVQNEGYVADTILVNPAQYKDLLTDKDIRDAMPRETRDSTVQSGRAPQILGLNVLVTPQLTAGTVFVLASGIVGTIADEAPDPSEGYAGSQAAPDAATIWVKTYEDTKISDVVVRAVRWPAMWLAEPKAAVKITAA